MRWHARLCAGLAGVVWLGVWAQAGPPATAEQMARHFADIRQAVLAADPSLGRPAPQLAGPSLTVLTDCLDASLNLGVQGDRDITAINIAMGIEQAQRTLQKLRLPPSLWQPHLDRMQRLAVDHMVAVRRSPNATDALFERTSNGLLKIEQALGRDATAALRRANPRAPEVVWADGCGAGEQAVEISTRPPGGRVSYITLFHYRLCQAKGQDADNPLQCRGWVEAVKKQEFLSGRYAYQVRWSDGSTRSGIFDTASAPPTRADSDVLRVTLTR